jgi:hypothetical protein
MKVVLAQIMSKAVKKRLRIPHRLHFRFKSHSSRLLTISRRRRSRQRRLVLMAEVRNRSEIYSMTTMRMAKIRQLSSRIRVKVREVPKSMKM